MSESLSTSATLQLGERLVVRCDDGLLGIEYALFEPTDIVLRATDPVTVRETGYITTARDALDRLAKSGITLELAHHAARAMAPEVVASFARVQAARSLATQLGPSELFEGGVYRNATQRYDGTWLDLRALSSALRIDAAAAVLQALHLVAVLAEVDRGTVVHLATANATRNRRPGERTHRRVDFESAHVLPSLLGSLGPYGRAAEYDPQREEAAREALLGRARERGTADAKPELRAHLARLEKALAGEAPPLGPLADAELWSIERQLAAGDAGGVLERLDQLEAERGRTAGTRYLRARAALVRGDEPPRSVAQTLSALVVEEQSFHEAELVAARAWLAAGEDAHARYFAHRLADDAKAADSARLVALEILDATARTHGSAAPPAEARHPPPPAKSNATGTQHETRQQNRPPPGPAARRPFPHAPPGASMPAVETMPPPPGRGPEVSGARAAALLRYDPEIVEALALPLGATEDVLVV
ncbi:MAG: hypothetical protein M3O50_14040, partial [Myxococcota bacterium]|nr:hypothetical protein [Myxococcota bacterium]